MGTCRLCEVREVMGPSVVLPSPPKQKRNREGSPPSSLLVRLVPKSQLDHLDDQQNDSDDQVDAQCQHPDGPRRRPDGLRQL